MGAIDPHIARTTPPRDRPSTVRHLACAAIGPDATDDASATDLVDAVRASADEDMVLLGRFEAAALVVLPTTTPADAWIRLEHLRRRTANRITGPATTLSAGIVVARDGEAADLVDMAATTLAAARRQGGDRVWTWTMVLVERLARRVAIRHDAVGARREAFIRDCASLLGTTQLEHMTAHCDEVAALATRLAVALNLDDATVDEIAVAGSLHDIGKCIVPESLLAKPKRLDADEWSIMTHHVHHGARLSEALGASAQTVGWVRAHHARFDAASGDAEPLAARILPVADAVITMGTARPYSDAMSRPAIVRELRRHRGAQFDPDVADAAIGLMERRAAA